MPVAGLEPARIAPHDFESCASANSATPALHVATNEILSFFVCFVNVFLYFIKKGDVSHATSPLNFIMYYPITFFTASNTRSA